ncbi:unnamed protein product, partial [Allacma fusca]
MAKSNREGGCSDHEGNLADEPFTYDCSGKQDGNYPHPTKCTHYVACVAKTYAYEMVLNHDGTPLHYVQNCGPKPFTSRFIIVIGLSKFLSQELIGILFKKEDKRIRCFAHIINLSCQAALTVIKSIGPRNE